MSAFDDLRPYAPNVKASDCDIASCAKGMISKEEHKWTVQFMDEDCLFDGGNYFDGGHYHLPAIGML